jgi:predicted TPR repeat methyltransferase
MASAHDKYARDYDNQIKNHDCHIAEILFGLSYEYIKNGDSLLDIGIGTGISSKLFNLAGLNVFGIDGSAEMLDICKTKGIAKELVEQDLLVFPWPYQKDTFDHIISWANCSMKSIASTKKRAYLHLQSWMAKTINTTEESIKNGSKMA